MNHAGARHRRTAGWFVAACGVAASTAALGPWAPLASAQTAPALIREGNELFRAGEFDQALKTYAQAAQAEPGSLEARFNQGVAAYKQGDAEAARKLFREVDAAGGNQALAAMARYNLGVLQAQELQSKPPEKPEEVLSGLDSAARLFRGSLDLAPADPQAARNLELTRRAMRDVKQEIERQRAMQQALEDLKKQLQQNEQAQQQAAQENKERADRPPEDPSAQQQQQQEARAQQQQASDQTKDAQQQLENLRQQMQPQQDHKNQQPQQDQQQPSPQQKLDDAARSLDEAREKQEDAEQRIEQGELDEARADQEAAAQKLREALEKLGGESQQRDEKEGEGEKQPQPQEPQEQPQQEQPQQDQQQEQQPQPEPAENAQEMEGESGEQTTDQRLGRILEKERRDRETRKQMMQALRGRGKPVEKDW